ncbi:MAG: NAD-dependent epimerase/dehydratase family protein [Pseudonocardiaceae bacterium]
MINHESDQRTVLVTGAAGLIGVPVVRRFRDQGHHVVAVDDGSAGTLGRLNEFSPDADVVVRVLDIRHRIELERLLAAERPWAVVHLAARHFIPDCERSPDQTLDINVLGTQHLMDACAAHPPQRLVFASTADVYAASARPHAEDDPVAPQGVYGCSKLLGEWLFRDQTQRLLDCAITVARLFNVYGPGDPHAHLLPEVLRQAQRGTVLHLGDLGAARDFVYVEDAADALIALTHTAHPGVFNIGTGTPVLGRELVNLVADVTGRPLKVHLDRRRLRRQSRPVSCAVPRRLCTLLPWWPRTGLREGIQRTIAADLGDTTDECESRAS